MTAEEFRQAGLLLFGPERGWQSRFADALGTDRASISRYLSGTVPIPGPVLAAVQSWLRAFIGSA
ncbi:MAG: helix-turn-helix transcriptional regulator [Bauldia sp.]|nr:helix-turn-helix transcriptional regulator [Bauldia sp.]